MKLYQLSVLLLILLFSQSVWSSGAHTGDLEPAKPIIEKRALTADEQIIQDLLDLYAKAFEKKDISYAEQAVIPNDFSTIESGYANWSWDDFKKVSSLSRTGTFYRYFLQNRSSFR